MGIYINPKTMSKEDFLRQNSTYMSFICPNPSELNDNEVIVCLVDNDFFTAAGVIFDMRELKAWLSDDGRIKRWCIVDKNCLTDDVIELESFNNCWKGYKND